MLRRNLKCPNCGRLLIMRSRPMCSYCEHPVPKELLFNAEEMAEVEAAKRHLELAAEQRRIRLKQEEEEAARNHAAAVSFYIPPL